MNHATVHFKNRFFVNASLQYGMKLQLVLIIVIFNSWLFGQVAPYPDLTYDEFLCTGEKLKKQMICLNNRIPDETWGNLFPGTPYSPCSYASPSLPLYNDVQDFPTPLPSGWNCGGVCCGTNTYMVYPDAEENRSSYYTLDLRCINNPLDVSITKLDEMCWSIIYLDTGTFLFSLDIEVRYGREIDGYYCEDTNYYNTCGEDRSWKQFTVTMGNQYPCNKYENTTCNLVQNGGFESKANCPTYDESQLENWNRSYNFGQLLNWTELVNGQEPYFFSTCNDYFGTNGSLSSLFQSYPAQPLPSGDNYVGLYFSYFKMGQPLDLCENQKYRFDFMGVKFRGNYTAGALVVNLGGINTPSFPTGNTETPLTTVAIDNNSFAWNSYSKIFTCPANFNGVVLNGNKVMIDDIAIVPIDTVILDIQLLSNSCDSGEMTLTIPGCYGPYDVDLVVEGDTINLTQIQDGHVVTIPIVIANTTVEVLSITNSMGCITVLNETDNFVVNNVEDASFTSNDFCEGQTNTITFLGDTGVFSLVNNTTAATINPSTGIISGAIAPNTYIIRHDVCLDFAFDTIQVIKNDASFTSTNICVGGVNTVNITGTTGGVFSILPPANGATINASTGELSNVSVGNNYTVQYKVGTLCPDSSTQIVQAVDIENPSFTTSDFCVNAANVISISGVPGGTFSFSPTPSDTATINSTTGVISGASVGASYTIKYVTPGTCKDSITRTVNVLGLPTATISGAGGDLCVNDSLPLTINLTGIPPWNVNYTDGSNVFSVSGITSSPITVYAKTSGDYQVVFVKDLQCSNIGDTTSSVTITGDSITFWSDFTEGCKPQEIKLWSNVSGLAGDCFWDFGDGDTQNLCDTVYHTYQNAGTYSVKLTVSSVGCNADTIMDNLITIHENPIASYYYNPSAPSIVYNRIKLTNTSIDNITNQWFLDSAIVSSIAEPEITLPSEIGSNLLCLVVENIYGCYDTSCVEVFVSDESLVYVPNAFVPDNNGLNDVFKPIISNVVEYDFKIFNRWGQVVFNTKEINKGWDGTFLGAKCPIGVYNYKIVYKYKGDIHDRYYRGYVNLLR